MTRIVYLKKKTTSKLNENASPIESKFDELEFQITKSEKKSKSEYSVNNAIEQVKNNVTLEVLQGSKSKWLKFLFLHYKCLIPFKEISFIE